MRVKTKEGKIVSLYLSTEACAYLTRLSLERNISKSTQVQDLIISDYKKYAKKVEEQAVKEADKLLINNDRKEEITI